MKEKLLTEAVAINQALFFLEQVTSTHSGSAAVSESWQVIVALGERGKGKRAHIPYRNSMMTSVLRDR